MDALNGAQELPVCALAGTRQQIHPAMPGVLTAQRAVRRADAVLQERARPRPAVEAPPDAPPVGLESAVHLAHTEGERLRLERRRAAQPPPRPGEPEQVAIPNAAQIAGARSGRRSA